jgi:peptidoglycan hydrolase-like protein with peptidoglycan-binding domain
MPQGWPTEPVAGTLRPMPARRSTRSLLLILAVGLSLLAPAQVSAASNGPIYPTQSVGDRGTDVRAIQLMLTASGFPVTASGVYNAATQATVIAWKTANGYAPASSSMDDISWVRLTPTLGPGASGPGVQALELELRAKRHLDVVVDGIWDATTSVAVKAFQRHAGIRASGLVGESTWRRLISHFELPSFNSTSLCDYSVGNGKANWGTAATIGLIEQAARVEARLGHGRVAVGDVGFEHGGPIPGHHFHRRGMEVDLRPMRKAKDQCRRGVNIHSAAYDRAATRALVKAIRATAPGHIKLIYFNDPVLIKEGLTRRYTGHDDHLHVRYCELTHPDPMFAC